MSALVRVEDPDTFNAPLTMTRRWFKFDGPMLETVCAENNGDFFNQNLFPQPETKRPTSELTSSLSVRLSRSSHSSTERTHILRHHQAHRERSAHHRRDRTPCCPGRRRSVPDPRVVT